MSSFDPETGIWLVADKDSPEHVYDARLAEAIEALKDLENPYSLGSIVDLGCGLGHYVYYFHQCGGMDAYGYDGNPNTPRLTEGKCGVLDLSKPIALPQFEWVLSLEVGEHIPAEHEETFIENLTKTAKDFIILSWAIPGQEGLGHVNCQPNEYIISRIEERGFTHVPELSAFLRYYASLSWFKHTIMVFKRKKVDATTD